MTKLIFVFKRRWILLLLLPLLSTMALLLLGPSQNSAGDKVWVTTSQVAVNQRRTTIPEVEQSVLRLEQNGLESSTEGATNNLGIKASFSEKEYVVTIDTSADTKANSRKKADEIVNGWIRNQNEGTAEGSSARVKAAEGAVESAQGALDLAQEEGTLNDVTTARSVLISAQSQLEQLKAEERDPYLYNLISIGNPALKSTKVFGTLASVPVRIMAGLTNGLLAAAIIITIVERLNPRVDAPDDAVRLIEAPILAMVPLIPRKQKRLIERASFGDFHGPFAESYRGMRAHLDFLASADDLDGASPRIMVASAAPGEGKSASSAYLAMAYAEDNRHPLVIGADLRRPTVHRYFDISRSPGLTSRLEPEPLRPDVSEIIKVDMETEIAVVPSGPAVDRVTSLVLDLKLLAEVAQKQGKVVIMDTAPVTVAYDAIGFLPAVDWVVVVVRIGRSTHRSLKRMIETLRLNDANIVGVVAVGALEGSDARRYYLNYYDDQIFIPGPGSKERPANSAE